MAVFYFLKEFGKFRIIILYFPLGDKFRVVVELMVDLDYHFHSALSFSGPPQAGQNLAVSGSKAWGHSGSNWKIGVP